MISFFFLGFDMFIEFIHLIIIFYVKKKKKLILTKPNKRIVPVFKSFIT